MVYGDGAVKCCGLMSACIRLQLGLIPDLVNPGKRGNCACGQLVWWIITAVANCYRKWDRLLCLITGVVRRVSVVNGTCG